jgi:hypothetical protein
LNLKESNPSTGALRFDSVSACRCSPDADHHYSVRHASP